MLDPLLHDLMGALRSARERDDLGLRVRELGTVFRVDQGIATARGLPDVTNEELVFFPSGARGLVVDLEPNQVSIALLDSDTSICAGTVVSRSGRVLDVPVGEAMLGRVIDPLGRPLDSRPAPHATQRLPVERPAPPIIARDAISRPLHTGITAIDAMIPIGRGQRELIVGDRQTGKTSVVIDTILHQKPDDVICVYCAIGQQKASMTRVIERLRRSGALKYTVVVLGEPDQPAGLRYIAPYSAMSVAESFMDQGRDVLVIYDDLTQHALAYRELSLLMRRPPGREAFPGDIFFVHSRLLERATQLKEEYGGGSITALPIVETEAEDISAYIPTNIVSITDGQIYLSPALFQHAQLPAIDVGNSVSRVGAKAQLRAHRKISSRLKLAYAQYEELERFARFGTRMDSETRERLEHGQRVRELLKQHQYKTLRPAEQIAMLMAVTENLLACVAVDQVAAVGAKIRAGLSAHPLWMDAVESGDDFDPSIHEPIREMIRVLAGEVA